MKKVFTFYKKSQKGQDLVEYALMLADHHRYRMGDLLPDRSRRLDQECVRKCIEPYGDGKETGSEPELG